MEPTDSTHCGNLTDEQRAILGNQAAAVHPQPIDYGLTHDDMRIHRLGSFDRSGLKYKEENKWFGWKSYLAIWFVVYIQGFIIYAALHPEIPGGWTWNNEHAVGIFLFGMLTPVFFPGIFVFGLVLKAIVNSHESHKRRHPSVGVLAYREAFQMGRIFILE